MASASALPTKRLDVYLVTRSMNVAGNSHTRISVAWVDTDDAYRRSDRVDEQVQQEVRADIAGPVLHFQFQAVDAIAQQSRGRDRRQVSSGQGEVLQAASAGPAAGW